MSIDIFETMEKLASVYGPAGRETTVAEKLLEMAKPYSDEIRLDVMGNVIARKKGGGKKVMFSAHMDSIGLIVTHIDDCGYLRFSNLGGIPPARILGTLVTFGNGTRGIVGCDGKADMKNLKLESFFIDIGARDGDEARQKIRLGDAAVYDQPTLMLGTRIASPYLDDRIACVVQLAAMERIKKPVNDLYFVFSVQEELGCRGSKTAAFAIEPDYGFAVDVTGVGDVPETKPKMDVRLGGGAAIKIMDMSVMCHPRVVEYLRKRAEEGNIPHQMEILLYGGTDASTMQVSRGGAYAGGISIPTRYVHNPIEMCDLGDVEACVDLLVAASEIELKY